MGVGKKLRRILSFGRKKGDKPAIEAPKNVDKSNTLNGTKRTSSLASLGRKFSFGSKDKKEKKERTKKNVPPTPVSTNPQTVVAPETVETAPLVEPEVAETVVEAAKAPQPAVEVINDNLAENTLKQSSVSESPLVDKVKMSDKQEDIKDANPCGDGIKLASQQSESLDKEHADKPTAVSNEPEEPEEVPAAPVVEPKTITEVLNKIHDMTETNQTGNEFVRTVETEQERTLAEDGTTVISQSTKTTTTTCENGTVGNVSQVKTEIKKEVMPPVSNGHSRQISQRTVKGPNYSFLLAFGVVLAAFAFAILYKYKDSGMLLAV